MATAIRRPAAPSPARWQRALQRALAEGIQVRQLAGSGGWVATSGTQAGAAYELEITGTIAHGCGCLAGLNGDAVCKHRAAWYFSVGLLDPEPDPPAAPLVYTGTFAGKDRVVTVVERPNQSGVYDIIDYTHKQKLGEGGSLDFILNRLHEGGFVPALAAAA